MLATTLHTEPSRLCRKSWPALDQALRHFFLLLGVVREGIKLTAAAPGTRSHLGASSMALRVSRYRVVDLPLATSVMNVASPVFTNCSDLFTGSCSAEELLLFPFHLCSSDVSPPRR